MAGVSADGAKLAYVAIGDGTRSCTCARSNRAATRVVLADPRIEHPSWSPTGDRLRGRRPGRAAPCTSHRSTAAIQSSERASRRVGVESRRQDARARRAAAADAIAPVGYNGDPDRTGDREANLLATTSGHLWTVDAPSRPITQLAEQPGATRRSRALNADAFDQLWNRTASLYYSAPDATARRAQWETLKTKYRPRAARRED